MRARERSERGRDRRDETVSKEAVGSLLKRPGGRGRGGNKRRSRGATTAADFAALVASRLLDRSTVDVQRPRSGRRRTGNVAQLETTKTQGRWGGGRALQPLLLDGLALVVGPELADGASCDPQLPEAGRGAGQGGRRRRGARGGRGQGGRWAVFVSERSSQGEAEERRRRTGCRSRASPWQTPRGSSAGR